MELSKRKSIRLSGYDYSQNGYYFITICTQDRQCIFGDIVGAHHNAPEKTVMKLNEMGIIVKNTWGNIERTVSHIS